MTLLEGLSPILIRRLGRFLRRVCANLLRRFTRIPLGCSTPSPGADGLSCSVTYNNVVQNVFQYCNNGDPLDTPTGVSIDTQVDSACQGPITLTAVPVCAALLEAANVNRFKDQSRDTALLPSLRPNGSPRSSRYASSSTSTKLRPSQLHPGYYPTGSRTAGRI